MIVPGDCGHKLTSRGFDLRVSLAFVEHKPGSHRDAAQFVMGAVGLFNAKLFHRWRAGLRFARRDWRLENQEV